MKKDLDVLDALREKMIALEAFALNITTAGKVSMNMALESEQLIGHNGLLMTHFSTASPVAKNKVAMESVMSTIKKAFKDFLAKIIEMFKKMVRWFRGMLGGSKNALKPALFTAYNGKEKFDYDEHSKAVDAGVRNAEQNVREGKAKERLEENDKEWFTKLKPIYADVLLGGDYFKAVASAAHDVIQRNIVGRTAAAFKDTQDWETDAFHQAVDLDMELLRKPAADKKEDHEAFKTKITEEVAKREQKLEPLLAELADSQDKVKNARSELSLSGVKEISAIKVDYNTVNNRVRDLRVPEFIKMQEEQARTLDGIVDKLEEVEKGIKDGEGVLQPSFQIMRDVYTKELMKLVGGVQSIQSIVAEVSSAFTGVLEGELFLVSYNLSRTNVLIDVDPSNADQWRDDRLVWAKRRSDLYDVLEMI